MWKGLAGSPLLYSQCTDPSPSVCIFSFVSLKSRSPAGALDPAPTTSQGPPSTFIPSLDSGILLPRFLDHSHQHSSNYSIFFSTLQGNEKHPLTSPLHPASVTAFLMLLIHPRFKLLKTTALTCSPCPCPVRHGTYPTTLWGRSCQGHQ